MENNTARHAVVQAGLPEIWGSLIQEDSTLDPGGEGSFRLGVTNDGAPATNVVLRAKIENGGEILRAVPTDWGFGPPTARRSWRCGIESGSWR